MAKVETKTARVVELELPPAGGNLSVVLEEDAHYLRVTLDKAENFKVAAGKRLRELLVNKFGNNENALRDWYEEHVAQGKAHRAWGTVYRYLVVVRNNSDEKAAAMFAEREQRDRESNRERLTKYREDARAYRSLDESSNSENANEINGAKPTNAQSRAVKTPYEMRREWLADMNVLWFKGEREWQDRWLQDRGLSRNRGLG